MQTNALLRAGVTPDNLWFDKKSGKSTQRVGLQNALVDARPGDVLVVWKLDRLSRSLRDLMDVSDQLAKDGIELRSLHENIDTSSPMGKFFFHLMAALAEFERSLISFRTSEGMQEAKREGQKFGPAPKLSAKQLKQVIDQLRAGENVPTVAKRFKVSRQLVYSRVLETTGKRLWRAYRKVKNK